MQGMPSGPQVGATFKMRSGVHETQNAALRAATSGAEATGCGNTPKESVVIGSDGGPGL